MELPVRTSCKDLVVAEEVHVWFPPFIPVNKTIFIYNGVRQKQSNSHVKTVKALEKLKEKRRDVEKFGISGVDILWPRQRESKNTFLHVMCVFIRRSLFAIRGYFLSFIIQLFLYYELLVSSSCVFVL